MYSIEHPDITQALRTGYPHPIYDGSLLPDDEDAISEAVDTFFDDEEDDSCRKQ